MTDPVRPATIVIVDDDPALIDVCRLQLRRNREFSLAATATTAQEGREVVCELQPNIALIDLRLPDADGRVLMPELVVSCPKTMIAALSVHEAEQAEAEVLATGAFAYYEKGMLRGGRLLLYLAQDLALFRRALAGEDVVAPSALMRRPLGADPH